MDFRAYKDTDCDACEEKSLIESESDFSRGSSLKDEEDFCNLIESFIILARINDSSKNFTLYSEREEHKIKMSKQCVDTVLSLVTLICRNIQCVNDVINRIDLTAMKIYTKDGVEMEDDDLYFLKNGDIVYLDLMGKPFNQAQILDQYVRISRLKIGHKSEVHKLQDKDTKKFVTQKIIYFENNTNVETEMEEFCRHVNRIKDVRHGNIVKILNIVKYELQVWVLTEYAKGCKLKEYLDFKYNGSIGEVEARELISQILRTISYCHQK